MKRPLAEAEVPYDQVFEMEDINGELGTTDVVLVLARTTWSIRSPQRRAARSTGMPI